MDHFKVLPTDERFKELSDEQLAFIMESMSLDIKERELAMKGVDKNNYFEDSDESFWEVPLDEFNVLEDGHDAEDIARQAAELVGRENLRKVRDRFETTQEYNEFLEKGGKLAREVESDRIQQEQLEKVFKEARELEEAKSGGKIIDKDIRDNYEPKLAKKEKETIEEAIRLFEGEHPTSEDDDDFYL